MNCRKNMKKHICKPRVSTRTTTLLLEQQLKVCTKLLGFFLSGWGFKISAFLISIPTKSSIRTSNHVKTDSNSHHPRRPKEFLDAWFGLGFSTSPSDPVSNDQGNITQSSPRVRNRHSWLEAACLFPTASVVCHRFTLHVKCYLGYWVKRHTNMFSHQQINRGSRSCTQHFFSRAEASWHHQIKSFKQKHAKHRAETSIQVRRD